MVSWRWQPVVSFTAQPLFYADVCPAVPCKTKILIKLWQRSSYWVISRCFLPGYVTVRWSWILPQPDMTPWRTVAEQRQLCSWECSLLASCFQLRVYFYTWLPIINKLTDCGRSWLLFLSPFIVDLVLVDIKRRPFEVYGIDQQICWQSHVSIVRMNGMRYIVFVIIISAFAGDLSHPWISLSNIDGVSDWDPVIIIKD